MENHCFVVCGSWCVSNEGNWDFLVDKQRMSRVVCVSSQMKLQELKDLVAVEFGLVVQSSASVLSFWPPTVDSSSIHRPPVLLTSDGWIGYFLKCLSVDKNFNLFVSFDSVSGGSNPTIPCVQSPCKTPVHDVTPVDLNLFGKITDSFETDCTPPILRTVGSKTKSTFASGPHSTENPSLPSHLNKRHRLGQVDVLSTNGQFSVHGDGSSCINRSQSVNCTEDSPSWMAQDGRTSMDETTTPIPCLVPRNLSQSISETDKFIAEVEDVEARFKTQNPQTSLDSDADDGLGSLDGDDDGVVLPRGYQTEFWEDLITGELGGSNAPDIMLIGEPLKQQDLKSNGPQKHHYGGRKSATSVAQSTGDASQSSNSAPPCNRGLASQPWVGYGGQGSMYGTFPHFPLRDPCNLEDTDDEAFDIPPIVDDTEYKSLQIPDLDVDPNGEEIYVGKVYANKQDCQIAFAIYAIKQQFHFKQTTTKRDSFVLTCTQPKCDWRILAVQKKINCNNVLKKVILEHLCDLDIRNGYKGKVTSKVIGSVYKGKFVNLGSCPRPLDLKDMVLEDLGVAPSYMQCWRAKDKAIADVRGEVEDSYLKLPDYFRRLKLTNPGTITHLETEKDEDDMDRYLYSFLAFGASISAFKHLRRMIVLDCTHLFGKYQGILLTASAQDANFQVFPLAFGVVDSENDASWTWFLSKLEGLIGDNPTLTFISDRHQSIYKAKSRIYPKAHHGACLVHLQRNVISKYKNQGLADLVGSAACAYRVGGFRHYYNQIWNTNRTCGEWLQKIGPAHWLRAYFNGNRYNLMTSNIAESLNNALFIGRSCHITDLYQFICSLMSRWFDARKRKSQRCTSSIPPAVDKLLTKTTKAIKAVKVNSLGDWTVEVIGKFNERHKVDLLNRQCTCRVYDKEGTPCWHAILAGNSKGVDHPTLCQVWYRTPTWVLTYSATIHPELDRLDEEPGQEDTSLQILPPFTRRPTGRPREGRYPSTGELQGPKQPKKESTNRCGKCNQVGHNRTTCKNPIV